MTASASADLGALRDVLKAAVAPGSERDVERYDIDGATPGAAFEPGNREDLATLVRLADEHGLAVVPQGARTSLALGRPLAGYDLAVDLGGLRQTVEYVPDDLTVTVEAGRRLGALQAELREHGQYLPIDVPPNDDVTIGGLLATARPGFWRGHLPAARDLILGIEVCLPTGGTVRSGGRVVKNVTGYDLHRLHTGALGAFGVIVEATFKVAPYPEASRTLVAKAPNLEAATALALRTWDASPVLRALTVLTSSAARLAGLEAAPQVLVELAGAKRAIDRSATDLASIAPFVDAPAGAWGALRRAQGDSERTVVRAGVAPTATRTLLERIDQAGGTGWTNIAPGAVVAILPEPTAEAIESLRSEAERLGGFLQVESAPAELRRQVAPSPGDTVLVEALRDRFDAKRTINRGRWGAVL
ncbi:MAG: FAD-binding oxidoreductase [Dehalococcoidia bacterium]|nr:FAD-binding oxidoreductase [Dehalococcoidia bacterium]